MANINTEINKQQTFDAIVIGSGISGGWAAKELTAKGLKTLVLERGRDVQHLKDYPTTNMFPYEFEHRLELTEQLKKDNPIVSKCYAFKEDAMHFMVKDAELPYVQEKPFDWIRGYQVGGKSLLWARQTQRWSDFDFEGPARDGFAVDWPIRYKDLKDWYSYVEKFAGIAGNKDGLPQLPDGDFLPGYPLNALEDYFAQQLKSQFANRHVISARCAHLSKPKAIHLEQGRAQCQNRLLCQRGCPFGGYFSSNSSTLPWAQKTGRLTILPHSIAESVIYDEDLGRATGVNVINSQTNEKTAYFARIIFVNASAFNTNQILLNSTSNRFPNGLGNDNGLLGTHIAFHNYRAKVTADYDGLTEFSIDGRNPAFGGYIPRFRNLFKQETDFIRGYAATFNGGRFENSDDAGFGFKLKEQLANPKLGGWKADCKMMGETIPKKESRLSLIKSKSDAWGMPLINIALDYDDNDERMIKDFHEQMSDMYQKAGFTNIKTHDSHQAPGLDIHEMGGVRMGNDSKTSLLNKHNQLHHCKNVFVTDGACMTSTSTQNPSLTYMALTARAVDYGVSEINRKNL